MNEETAVARIEQSNVVVYDEEFTNDELRKACRLEAERREILDRFVRDNLKRDVDYGKVKGCGDKDFIFKSGTERIQSLLHIRPEFSVDKDTWIMLGKTPGTVCYICRYYRERDGKFVGEGRGVVEAEEKQWKGNMRVKMCQTRSQRDAVLRVSGLSDRFTQDEDSPEFENRREKPESRGTYQKPTKSEHAPSQRGPAAPQGQGGEGEFAWLVENAAERISEPQYKKLCAMLKARDIDPNEFKRCFRFQHLHDMSWKSTKYDEKYGTKSVYDEIDAGTFDFLRGKGTPKPYPATAPTQKSEDINLDDEDPFNEGN